LFQSVSDKAATGQDSVLSKLSEDHFIGCGWASERLDTNVLDARPMGVLSLSEQLADGYKRAIKEDVDVGKDVSGQPWLSPCLGRTAGEVCERRNSRCDVSAHEILPVVDLV
jgi:hypothetical protein